MSGSAGGRIFVGAPARFGRVVLSIPAVRRLAERYPDAEIDIWCPFRYAPVLEMAELRAAVIPFRPTRAVQRLALRVRGRSYASAYLLGPTLSMEVAVRIARVPTVRRGGVARWWRFPGLRAQGQRRATEHEVRAYLDVVEAEGSSDRLEAPGIRVPARAREQFDRLVGGRLARPALGVLPGAGAPSRRWPAGRFTALAGLMAHRVGAVVVFGAPGEEVLAARVAAAAGPKGIDLGGRTGLPVLAAGLADCDAVIANETGAMHLAAAVGTPVVAVFGSGDPGRGRPLGKTTRVHWASQLPCAPCHRRTCPRRGPGTYLPEAREECLALVSVEAAVQSTLEVLSTARTTSYG